MGFENWTRSGCLLPFLLFPPFFSFWGAGRGGQNAEKLQEKWFDLTMAPAIFKEGEV